MNFTETPRIPGPSKSTTTSPPALSPVHGWIVALLATLAMSVSYVDRQTLAALAPTVRKALDIDHTMFGWLTAAFSMSYLLGAPLAGVLLDRVGARRGLAGAVLVWSAVAALHALAPNFAVLFALRIVLGAAESPSFPGAAQAIKRTLRGRQRNAAYGLLFTGSSIGAMVAAPAAIALKVKHGWQVAFVVVAAAGALWVPLWLLATSGAAARAIARDPEHAHDSPDAAAPQSLTTGQALRALARSPALHRAVVLMVACSSISLYALNWFPQYLEAQQHVHQDDLGKYLWVPPLFLDAGALGFAALAGRPGARGPIVAIAVASLMGTCLAILPMAGDPRTATGMVAVALGGSGAMYALLTADVLARVPPGMVSAASGITAAAQSLIHIVVNPLVGASIDRTHSFNGSAITLGALILPMGLAWIAAGWHPRLEPRRVT